MSANLFPSKRMTPQQVGLLSAAVPSPYGDALGLMADAMGYAQDPRSLTPMSGLLSLAGMLPGVPSKQAFDPKNYRALDVHVTRAPYLESIRRKGLIPGRNGNTYWWKDGSVDPGAIDEIMGYKELRRSKSIGILPDANRAKAVQDPELLDDDAYMVPGGVPPSDLFLWSDKLKQWTPLLGK